MLNFSKDARRLLRRLGMTAGLLLMSTSVAANPGKWHEDPAAGVRFRVPFTVHMTKTGEQVENLIRHQNLEIPANLKYTSGVYAEGGFPYILVWRQMPDGPSGLGMTEASPAGSSMTAELPSRLSLSGLSMASVSGALGVGGEAPLKFSRRRLVALGPELDAGDGVKTRLVAQLTRNGTVYLGYFFKDKKHAEGAPLSVLAGSLTVAADKRLTWNDLPWVEEAAWPWLALLGAALTTALILTSLKFSRRVWRS